MHIESHYYKVRKESNSLRSLASEQAPAGTHMDFGSDDNVRINKQFRHKMDKKAKKLILVGYQGKSSNYRLSDQLTNRIVVSRDVVFNKTESINLKDSNANEGVCVMQTKPNKRGNDAEENLEEINSNNESETAAEESGDESDSGLSPVHRTRSLRDRTKIRKPERYVLNLAQYTVPKTFQEATTGKQSRQWKLAIKEEFEAHQKNNTWTLVSRPKDREAIDLKWVFKIV
ncbi:hypothetical protein KM043_015751 [Ampulex compressa]|nr:hypothetical protein KM043_015751 [Ampulex compressa]